MYTHRLLTMDWADRRSPATEIDASATELTDCQLAAKRTALAPAVCGQVRMITIMCIGLRCHTSGPKPLLSRSPWSESSNNSSNNQKLPCTRLERDFQFNSVFSSVFVSHESRKSNNRNYYDAQKLWTNMHHCLQLAAERCSSLNKVDNFMSDGKVFHSDGPATEKLRGPKVTVLVRGTTCTRSS